jgi:hypothetical protein
MRTRLRRQARDIHIKSILTALVLTVLGLLLSR